MAPAVTFYTFALAIHIAAVVIAFGVTFAYPVMYAVGIRSEARAMPGVHRIASLLKRWLLGTHQGAVRPRKLAHVVLRSAISTPPAAGTRR